MTTAPLRRIRRVFAVNAVVLMVAAILIGFQSVPPAQAADVSKFDPGNLISDNTFYNSGAMSAPQVQSFITSMGSGCTANSLPCLKDVSVSNPAQPGTSYCAAMPASAGRNAGAAIVAVSQACGISPQVLLVLIEKEQSLVTRSSPSAYAYKFATGFGCPDSSGCSDAVAGLFVQLHSAGEQFQRYRENPSSYNFVAGQVNNILYNPNTACGTKAVYIQNEATAGLYDYTPYTPNAAALANPYGVGDSCSSYGNRNFWRIFYDWFGDPTGAWLQSASFENGVGGWAFSGSIDRAVYPGSGAQTGGSYLDTIARSGGATVSQTVNQTTTLGQTYAGAIWLRAPAGDVTGRVVVWGLGGSNENYVQPFTASTSWTQVTSNLLVRQPGHSQLRIQVYIDTIGRHLNLDNATLTRGADETIGGTVPLSSPSFEQGLGTWEPKNGFVNRVIYSGAAQDGRYFFATNTAVTGRSFGQDISTDVGAAASYTATVWMRSAGATPYTGTLSLWGLGAGTTQGVTPFTVGPTWTKVSVTMPVTTSGQNLLRLEVYERTLGATLYMDNATLVRSYLTDGSFEKTASGFAPSETGTNLALYTSTVAGVPAVDGGSVAATNATVSSGSIVNNISRMIRRGETYTWSVWLRAEAGKTFTGKLALWELGTATENATTAVTVTDSWKEFTVTKTISGTGDGTLRLQLYEYSPGVTVFMDGARLY